MARRSGRSAGLWSEEPGPTSAASQRRNTSTDGHCWMRACRAAGKSAAARYSAGADVRVTWAVCTLRMSAGGPDAMAVSEDVAVMRIAWTKQGDRVSGATVNAMVHAVREETIDEVAVEARCVGGSGRLGGREEALGGG